MTVLWLVLRELGMPASLSPDALSAWLNGQGVWGPVFLFLMMVLAVVVGPIPTLPVSAAAGLAFGVLTGTLLAASGALTGAMIAFYAARLLGREVLAKKLSGNPVFASDGSQRFLFWTVFLTRLIPLFSFALISYAAGVTAIHAWRFAAATLVGMLPMTFVFAGLGTTFELNPWLTMAAAVVILAIMSLLPWYLTRRPDSTISRWLKLGPKR
ncbi:TVP38/TMEM64 family protein [Marinobacter salicampi]|uniref:TVP38/TMEM64 family protein n=1 Tax=Marinobacter salicampi TaxID=435907 RepID=UPI00140740CD|nr:TVP38/TMEM64 family protein [Marinobacter salicampi]